MMIHKCKICGGKLSKFITDIFDDRHGYPGRFDIFRCTACGFGQTVPEIPEDKIGEIYTKYYPRKNAIEAESLKNQPIQLIPPLKRWWMGINNTAHYHIRNRAKVLDIGCGDCTSIREINAMGSEGYGIEPDQNIKTVVDILKLNVHIGVYHEIPYPDNFFDYITMSQVLEHIHNPVELLRSFKRILKDDGQVVIGVPNVDSRLRKKYGNRWLNWHVPYHINHFSRKSLNLLAEKSGYSILKIRTYTPNLWIELQKKLFNYPVQEGIRVPFFNGEPDPANEGIVNDKKNKPWRLLSRFLLKDNSRWFKIIKYLSILNLRIKDSFGLGESYLVFMKKKQ